MKTKFEFKYGERPEGYIEVEGTGHATARDIEEMYQELYQYAMQSGLKKLLVDAREIVLDYPMSEFVPLMKNIMPILSHFKISRLVCEEELRQELVQTISHKSGVDMKNFTDKTLALGWLDLSS